MKNLSVISLFVSKLAKNQASIKEYREEWTLEYYFLMAVKFLISIVSIYTAYNYLYNLTFPLLNKYSFIGAFIGLLVIEIGTTFLLHKWFKHTLRGRYNNTVYLLLPLIICFTISFQLSTNGIAQLMSEKKSNIEQIANNHDIRQNNIIADYDNRIVEAKARVSEIQSNPAGWQGGKRCILISSQLAKIDEISNDISKLRETKTELLRVAKNDFAASKNKDLIYTTGEANKYWYIVSFIMLLQVGLSGIIVFMSKKIYKIDETENYINSDVTTYQETVIEKVQEAIIRQVQQLSGTAINQFSLGLSMPMGAPVTTNEPKTEPLAKVEPAPEPETETKIVLTGEQLDNLIQKEIEKHTKQPERKIGFRAHRGAHVDTDKEKPVNTEISTKWGFAVCPICGTEFTKRSHNHKFCDVPCVQVAYEKRTGKKVPAKYKK